MKTFYITLILSLISISGYSQIPVEDNQKKENISSIQKLEYVIDKSNNYEQYKVIEKVKLNAAIQNVTNEFDTLTSEIEVLKGDIQSKNNEINSLQNQIKDVETKLITLQNEKDEVDFLGLSLTKSTYSIIVWLIIILLMLLFLLFVFKYNRSNLLTKEAKQNLKNLDADYENYKRLALEKQQKLGRQLQDEKNKHKNK